MSAKKKFESGASKTKSARDKQNREKNLLKSIPKLTGFFQSHTDDSGGSGPTNPPEEAAGRAPMPEVADTGEEHRGGADEERQAHEHQRGGDESDGAFSSDPGLLGNDFEWS